MKITNLSSGKVSQIDETTFDYGKIKKGSNTTFQLLFAEDSPIAYSKKSHCGCFTINMAQEEGSIKATFSYDSNLLGEFNKPVSIFYKKDGKEEKVQIKIKGIVK